MNNTISVFCELIGASALFFNLLGALADGANEAACRQDQPVLVVRNLFCHTLGLNVSLDAESQTSKPRNTFHLDCFEYKLMVNCVKM